MRQWIGSVLVQVMARLIFCVKLLSTPMTVIVNWNVRNKLNRNTKLFIHENVFEIVVCEMVAILSRGDELTQDEPNYYGDRAAIPS